MRPEDINILLACEESQAVTIEFRKLGFNAFSCDIQECSGGHPEWHINGDVLNVINDGWDIMIAHPPCTHLAVSGARWFKDKKVQQVESLNFVKALINAPIGMIALENPISIISSHIRKPDQIIQPWQFGHGETKATCLWLKNLPKLQPTNIVSGRVQRIWKMSPGPERGKLRSKTYSGIAKAMAKQWGNYLLNQQTTLF
jgi:site-specific DNA-cytosine methylase